MKIREYCEEDYPRILDIYRESKLDELRFERDKFELLPLDKDEKRLKQLEESNIYVYDNGSIEGYGAVYGSEIRALFVCRRARGSGVGKSLLELLLSKVIGTANLFVAKTNLPAKKLYESYGFRVTNEFQTEYNGISVYANEMVRPEIPSSIVALLRR